VSYALKILVPCVELKRARIGVFKTRVEICLMNKVRTVLRAMPRAILISRRIRDGPSFLHGQQSGIGRRSLCSSGNLRLCRRAAE